MLVYSGQVCSATLCLGSQGWSLQEILPLFCSNDAAKQLPQPEPAVSLGWRRLLGGFGKLYVNGKSMVFCRVNKTTEGPILGTGQQKDQSLGLCSATVLVTLTCNTTQFCTPSCFTATKRNQPTKVSAPLRINQPPLGSLQAANA